METDPFVIGIILDRSIGTTVVEKYIVALNVHYTNIRQCAGLE